MASEKSPLEGSTALSEGAPTYCRAGWYPAYFFERIGKYCDCFSINWGIDSITMQYL